jgi:N-acetylmuramoyl-L-alanine amidase
LRRPAPLLAAVLAALLVPATGAAGTHILGPPHASVQRAQTWARANGATPTFVRLARLYWRLAPERGIRPEVAYAQSAKETGFGHFGGVLDAPFHNPCGLKRSAGGGNYDRSAHRRFRTWRQGVTAHLDHLALYAGARGYPKRATPDPRHFSFLRGRAPTVQALGGAWAPSASYGREVLGFARQIGLAVPSTQHRGLAPVLRSVPAPHFARDVSI